MADIVDFCEHHGNPKYTSWRDYDENKRGIYCTVCKKWIFVGNKPELDELP
jgi:hypothetical protein